MFLLLIKIKVDNLQNNNDFKDPIPYNRDNSLDNNPINKNRQYQQQNINPPPGERCDGCFEGLGVCFCVNCEKIFCRMCEDQIHIVPSNRNHER